MSEEYVRGKDNLYFGEDGSPALRESFCVFMDVLGFAERIRESFKLGKGQEALERYREALKQQRRSTLNPEISGAEHQRWEMKVFTDNIVLGHPALSWHREPEFGTVVDTVGLYQLAMTLEGYFVRGGLTFGDLFMDDETVFGPALLDAYAMESKQAVVPRIILSEEAEKVVMRQTKFYGTPRHAPQNRDLLRDADNRPFVHYLTNLVWGDGYETYLDTENLAKHRDLVVANLRQHKGNKRVWDKYRWVANYHNYFCQAVESHPEFDSSLFVDDVAQSETFRPLVSE